MNAAQYADLLQKSNAYESSRIPPFFTPQIKSRVILVEHEKDNVYLNVVVDHPRVTFPTTPAIPSIGAVPFNAIYNQARSIPIIDKCSDYYLSVLNIEIPTDEIPLMIMPIVPNQANNNLTPFIIGIEYNGVTFPVQLIYLPGKNQIFAPPLGFQNLPNQRIDPYYFVYDYQTLINMVNGSLRQAYINSGLSVLLPGIREPYFYLDPITSLVSLVVHRSFTTLTAPLVAVPQIYMNYALQVYFDSFQWFFNGYDQPNGNDLSLILNPNTAFNLILYPNGIPYPNDNQSYVYSGTAATDPPTYFRFTEEYSALEYWASLKRIIVTTNSIPINREFVPSIVLTPNPINPIPIPSDQTVTIPVLADFVPILDRTAGNSRGIAYYYPRAQYKLVDLISDSPLQNIDLIFYWQDLEGNLYPIQISLFQEITIKIAFFKKSLYKAPTILPGPDEL